jgi:hypothetical protein
MKDERLREKGRGQRLGFKNENWEREKRKY